MNYMKIIACLLGIIIIGSVGYYFYSIMFSKNEIRSVEYARGKADTLFIPGNAIKTLSQKVFKGKIWVKKNGAAVLKDSADSGNIDSLSVFVKEINMDSVEVGFDFRYAGETNLRVDTLKIFRVDTLIVKSIIEKEIPFYQSLWFGILVGIATINIIMVVSK